MHRTYGETRLRHTGQQMRDRIIRFIHLAMLISCYRLVPLPLVDPLDVPRDAPAVTLVVLRPFASVPATVGAPPPLPLPRLA